MILDKVLDHAIATPNAVAIVDDKRTITYRELVWGSHLFAGMLEELAPRDQFGDKVALLIPPPRPSPSPSPARAGPVE